jgi:FtsP/CotA-like multicopper oxidase with cupredoxin domain
MTPRSNNSSTYTLFLFNVWFSSALCSQLLDISGENEVLMKPHSFSSSGTILNLTLSIEPLEVKLRGGIMTTRSYNKMIPGPTNRVRRGDTLIIRVENKLQLPQDASGNPPNSCRDPNVTNLHTHGLHVSPLIPQDFVLQSIQPEDFDVYKYSIPKNHAGGTFFYHPHFHGSTTMQVAGGMAGAIIVEDEDEDKLPAWLKNLPEQIMLLNHFRVNVLNEREIGLPWNLPSWSSKNS